MTAIHSVAGALRPERPMVVRPPFQAPHHTASAAALVGGGVGVARPGAVSLAHRGVLFLDEAPEFSRVVLDTLRQPMERGEVELARGDATVTYPARFQLVLAANPCPCGRGGGRGLDCVCTPDQKRRYAARHQRPAARPRRPAGAGAPGHQGRARRGHGAASRARRCASASSWPATGPGDGSPDSPGRPTPRCPARRCARPTGCSRTGGRRAGRGRARSADRAGRRPGPAGRLDARRPRRRSTGPAPPRSRPPWCCAAGGCRGRPERRAEGADAALPARRARRRTARRRAGARARAARCWRGSRPTTGRCAGSSTTGPGSRCRRSTHGERCRLTAAGATSSRATASGRPSSWPWVLPRPGGCSSWAASCGVPRLGRSRSSVRGRRRSTALHVASELATDLAARGWAVVSGGAYGIDAAAHRVRSPAEASRSPRWRSASTWPTREATPTSSPGSGERRGARVGVPTGRHAHQAPVPAAQPHHRRAHPRHGRGRGGPSLGCAEHRRRRPAARASGDGRAGPGHLGESAGCHRLARGDEPARIVTDASEVIEEVGLVGELAERREPAAPGQGRARPHARCASWRPCRPRRPVGVADLAVARRGGRRRDRRHRAAAGRCRPGP